MKMKTKTKTTKPKRPSIMRLFYIGERFYYDSGTAMGAYYEVGTNRRFEPTSIASFIERGRKILIKPASKSEIAWANKNLLSIRKELVGNV